MVVPAATAALPTTSGARSIGFAVIRAQQWHGCNASFGVNGDALGANSSALARVFGFAFGGFLPGGFGFVGGLTGGGGGGFGQCLSTNDFPTLFGNLFAIAHFNLLIPSLTFFFTTSFTLAIPLSTCFAKPDFSFFPPLPPFPPLRALDCRFVSIKTE